MGRPREFDADEALDCALNLFWKKGYEGTSLSDLTVAMGITRPSLYATFGNKEELFRKALDRYEAEGNACRCSALGQPTARQAVEQLLRSFVDAQTDPEKPHGCLVVSCSMPCGEDAEPIRREILTRRAALEEEIRGRLERAKATGDLPPEQNPGDLARYILTTANGLSVQAAAGTSRAELHRVIDAFMRGWPSP